MRPKPGEPCRSCGAAIAWAITGGGKRIPLDAEPNERGNIILRAHPLHPDEALAVTVGRNEDAVELAKQSGASGPYMPHHATCPHGRAWRRRQRR